VGAEVSEAVEITIQGERVRLPLDVLERYNVHGPRYTSYPTAPEWRDDFGPDDLRRAFERAETSVPKAPLSLYFHIPFCESLCWFCGCNVIINRRKEVAEPYLDHLRVEIERVAARVDNTREAVQFHWGGGTPTYLAPEQMAELYRFTAARFPIAADAEVGLEVDPRVTTEEHVATAAEVGFNRVSMGVQDFAPEVQKAINRIQSYEQTAGIVEACRSRGFKSVNIDLMYGLPYQTVESFLETVDRVVEISPDRVALFNYAHVPALRHAQNAFRRMPMPEGFEKFEIFRRASERFAEAGYVFIGLDHFAKPDDEMARAQRERTLWRNFQGYTTKAGTNLYAMGVSAISYVAGAYAQNYRDTPTYYERIEAGELPTMRGIELSDDDKLRASLIERLLCHCVVVKSEIEERFGVEFDSYFADALSQLEGPQSDGLVRLLPDRVEVTPLGRLFLRNLAMPFDAYLRKKAPAERPVFSKTL
jgi:oxygen-independent coproporphyrinogen-3 oxidase